ncbi:hypothetical protein [Aureivirga sp. CE67]|uniref:hypothetical protein n=1 Tax=Aureivirga sp. CE67 TaxID=1788983 RepID=UPI0018CAF435|nr:hypothetical protein [Aureivirga sp. CE67]
MKKLLFSFFFLISIFSFGQVLSSQKFQSGKFTIPHQEPEPNISPADCEAFKSGKFKINDKTSGVTEITREGSKQIEHNLDSGVKVEYKIEWIDHCNYKLSFVKILDNPKNEKVLENANSNVQIIKADSGGYEFKIKFDKFNLEDKNKMLLN